MGSVVNAPPAAVPLTLNLPQTIDVKACFGVASFAQCVPAAIVEEVLVLNADYTISTGYPDYTGVWSQPNGPTSLRLEFFEQPSGNTTIVYEGVGVSSSCAEGTGSGPLVPGAAFSACTL